jgi:hypothetical protein
VQGHFMSATELKTELDERTRLAAKYPDWHLWLSSADRPWATRRGNIAPLLGSDYPKDPRWRMTIDADTWPELEEVLKQQTDIDGEMLLRLQSYPAVCLDTSRFHRLLLSERQATTHVLQLREA